MPLPHNLPIAPLEDVGVMACPTQKRVIALAAHEHIIPRTAHQQVCDAAAHQRVAARAAEHEGPAVQVVGVGQAAGTGLYVAVSSLLPGRCALRLLLPCA